MAGRAPSAGGGRNPEEVQLEQVIIGEMSHPHKGLALIVLGDAALRRAEGDGVAKFGELAAGDQVLVEPRDVVHILERHGRRSQPPNVVDSPRPHVGNLDDEIGRRGRAIRQLAHVAGHVIRRRRCNQPGRPGRLG